jgi:thiamine kinase-like enzyme
LCSNLVFNGVAEPDEYTRFSVAGWKFPLCTGWKVEMEKGFTLRRELASRIERLLGTKVESCRTVAGGYTPALRLLCRTASAAFFVKVGVTPLTGEFLRREIRIYNSLRGGFMPDLVAWEDQEVEPILIIEDLSAHSWPPPWDKSRIERVLTQIDAMHNTKVSLEPYAEVRNTSGAGWPTVAADPEPFLSLKIADSRWLEAALPILLENEDRCTTEGGSLTHWDLRSDNICLTESRTVFVDWNLACLSNPKLDLGFWLPSLTYEGGPDPETILPDAPEIAAWVSGFFAARAGLPEITDAPRVRLVQRQQLETALPWAIRALDLPPPAVA